MRKGLVRKPWEEQCIKNYLDNVNVLKTADQINSACRAKKDHHQQHPNI